MHRCFALVLIPLVVLGWAVVASAVTPTSAGCAPRFDGPLTIDQAVAQATPFLIGDPEVFRQAAIGVDDNADGSVCLRIGEQVNPHFNARRILVVDNTVGPKH